MNSLLGPSDKENREQDIRGRLISPFCLISVTARKFGVIVRPMFCLINVAF